MPPELREQTGFIVSSHFFSLIRQCLYDAVNSNNSNLTDKHTINCIFYFFAIDLMANIYSNKYTHGYGEMW